MKTSKWDKDAIKVLATAALLLIDAMVFQEIIAKFYPNVRTLASMREAVNIKRALEREWSKIVAELDYEPIFSIALNILRELPATHVVNEGLKELVKVAEDIASSRVLLRHDLFGRIYHQLLLGKLTKYYATYYTSIPAARLLARLLVNLPSQLSVKEVPPKFGDEPLRVVDFACGSGTLLSAVYKELMIKHRLEAEEPRLREMHEILLEEVLWGFDVLQHATHLASTVLFLHEPSQPVEKSRIYALKLGVYGRIKRLGSIDFFKTNRLELDMLLTGERVGAKRVSASGEEIVCVEELPRFHYCIMNPPFTRSVGGNLLFGGLPKNQRRELQRELARILEENNISGIGQAGLGAVFVFLADKYLEKGGRVGLVLPKAVLGGVAWRKVREVLLEKYHIEYVISSFEGPNNWNFSENTSLSEVLLIARKKSGREDGFTVFVSLWRKPRSESESIFIGTQLLEVYSSTKLFNILNSNATAYPIRMRGKTIGEAYAAKIREADFGYLAFFAQAELNRVLALLRQGMVYLPTKGVVGHVPLTPLFRFIKDVGPDRHQVHGAFIPEDDSKSPYRALWGHDSNKIRTIRQVANKGLRPRTRKSLEARSLWEKSSRLLVVERVWLPTYRVVSILVDEPVLSNVWWPILIEDEEHAKILSLWLNSTLGMLLLFSIAQVTRGPWISIKKDMLRTLPVLDLARLSEEDKNALLSLYDEVSTRDFRPLPEEFERPDTRKIIDDAFCKLLGLKSDLSEVYRLLARDPMITGSTLS